MDLIIYKDGKPLYAINETLLKKQFPKLKERNKALKRIKELHYYKLELLDLMKAIDDKAQLRLLDLELNKTEGLLQNVWKFPVDSKWYKFWERPHCSCPKLDNMDAYPYGHYIANLDCPLHGLDTVQHS